MGMYYWIGFVAFIILLIALDLGVFHRKNTVMRTKEALLWSAFWIFLALLFNILVYYLYEKAYLARQVGLEGKTAALQFFTGYVLEKSLSLDNIFVIALIFAHYKIPLKFQHKVLTAGILGAIVFRAVMILLGSALIQKFYWLNYLLGGFLLLTAIRFLFTKEEDVQPKDNYLIKFVQRYLPLSSELSSDHFFIRREGKWWMTILFLALLQVEIADIIFAVDSIPAIFAITKDPFIVFTSNIFAILGLRALYFALASLMQKFRYLKMSLSFILAFVGFKLLGTHFIVIPIWLSLTTIVVLITLGIVLSIVLPKKVTNLLAPFEKDLESAARMTYKQIRRTIVFIVGFAVILLGIVLIFTPGPAILVIPIGILILSTEFEWAKVLLKKTKIFLKRLKHLKKEVKLESSKYPKGIKYTLKSFFKVIRRMIVESK